MTCETSAGIWLIKFKLDRPAFGLSPTLLRVIPDLGTLPKNRA